MRFSFHIILLLFSVLIITATSTSIEALRNTQQTAVAKFSYLLHDNNVKDRILINMLTPDPTTTNSNTGYKIPICVDQTTFDQDTSFAICRMLGAFDYWNFTSHQMKSRSSVNGLTSNFSHLPKPPRTSPLPLPKNQVTTIGSLKCPAYAMTLAQCDFDLLTLDSSSTMTDSCGFYFQTEVAVSCFTASSSTSPASTTTVLKTTSGNSNAPNMVLNVNTNEIFTRGNSSEDFGVLCVEDQEAVPFQNTTLFLSTQLRSVPIESFRNICQNHFGISIETATAFSPSPISFAIDALPGSASRAKNYFYYNESSPTNYSRVIDGVKQFSPFLSNGSTFTCQKYYGVICDPGRTASGGYFWRLSQTQTSSYTFINSFNGNPTTVPLSRLELAPMTDKYKIGATCDDAITQQTADLMCRNLFNSYRAEAFNSMNSILPEVTNQPIYLDETRCSSGASSLPTFAASNPFFASSCLYETTKNDCSHMEDIALKCTNEGFRSGSYFFKFYEESTSESQSGQVYYQTAASQLASGPLTISEVRTPASSTSASVGTYGMICPSSGFNLEIAQGICEGAFDFDPRKTSFSIQNVKLSTYSEATQMKFVTKIDCSAILTSSTSSSSSTTTTSSQPIHNFDSCKITTAMSSQSPCYADTRSGPLVQAVHLACTPYVESGGYQWRLTESSSSILQLRPVPTKNTEKKQWGLPCLSSSLTEEQKQKTADAMCSLLFPDDPRSKDSSRYYSSFFTPNFVSSASPIYMQNLVCNINNPSSIITSISQCSFKSLAVPGENATCDPSRDTIGLICYRSRDSTSGNGNGSAFSISEGEVLRNLVIVVGLCLFFITMFILMIVARIRTAAELARARRRAARRRQRNGTSADDNLSDAEEDSADNTALGLLPANSDAMRRNLVDFQAALLMSASRNNTTTSTTTGATDSTATTAAMLLSLIGGRAQLEPQLQQPNNNNNNLTAVVGQVVTAQQEENKSEEGTRPFVPVGYLSPRSNEQDTRIPVVVVTPPPLPSRTIINSSSNNENDDTPVDPTSSESLRNPLL
jgi:hypothetical protein